MTKRERPIRERERVIRQAAVELFRERGYEAATMRELGRRIGVEAPSLYNHFSSKADLLAELLIGGMAELVGAVRDAVAAAGDDPAEQLRAGLVAYVLFHEDRLGEASITDTERRSLRPGEAEQLLALRAELAATFRGVIDRGRETGAFVVQDPGIATLCLLSLCARLPVWYRPEGRLGLPEIADRIVAFTLHGLNEPPE